MSYLRFIKIVTTLGKEKKGRYSGKSVYIEEINYKTFNTLVTPYHT